MPLSSSDYDLKKKYDFKRIDIVRDHDPDLGSVRRDLTEIGLVYFNPIKNAAQAVSGQDVGRPVRILLRTAKAGESPPIEVEDYGSGMEEKTLQRVFEPFFTIKPRGVGTGLGLWVSDFCVTEQHKRTFSVSSAPGRRTSFSTRLPPNAGAWS